MRTFELSLRGYRLMTAEILYHMPDHPELLQSFLWQEFDVAPQFPVLNRFLHFWESHIDGRLHSVRVAARGLIAPAELKMAGGQFTLNYVRSSRRSEPLGRCQLQSTSHRA